MVNFNLILVGSGLSIVGVILVIWSSNLIQDYQWRVGQQAIDTRQELWMIQIVAALFVVGGNVSLICGALTREVLSSRQEISRR